MYSEEDCLFKGADLGILVTKARMQIDNGLTDKCVNLIEGIKERYVATPVDEAPRARTRWPT